MAHELASTGRLALGAERARIEVAQAALRKSARWQVTIAFGMPAVLSCVVMVATFVNYPGAWWKVLLLNVLQVFVIGLMSVVPTLVFGGYRVIALDRRLRRDAAARWPVEHVRGDVVWSRRRRALVATANGRPLASPFFTELKMLPSYWDHFDKLAPGSYQLELLRESGLVLSAKPCSESDVPARDDRPGNVALRAAFHASPDEIAANRRGQASTRQRLALLVASVWLLPALGLFGGATTVTLRAAIAAPGGAAIFGALLAATLTAFMTYIAACIALDVARGELHSRAGLVHLRADKTEERGTIDGLEFTISHKRARALQIGVRYRVYVFRHSRQVASAELA